MTNDFIFDTVVAYHGGIGMMSVVSLRIYADGACLKYPSHGGWAFVVYDDKNNKLFEDSGSEPITTNNRMELQAAICAAEYAILAGTYSGQQHGSPKSFDVEIFTDSKYVQQGITTWIHSWVKNNWKASNGAVKNQDLWERIHELSQALTIKWSWVKGHSGVEGNERADVLASTAAAQSQAQERMGQANTISAAPSQPLPDPKHATSRASENGNGKVYLNVPFADKDHAKKLGARWDPQKKQWYCQSQHQQSFARWL